MKPTFAVIAVLLLCTPRAFAQDELSRADVK